MDKLKVLIIEDEPLAAAQLASLLTKLRPDTKILNVCDTVESAVSWIKENPLPDLAFFDIQLGDGNSFEIFETVTFNVPVIFTTAYDQYTLKAFKVNSIDYILKPIEEEELKNALIKFESNLPNQKNPISSEGLEHILASFNTKSYKERFLVKIGNHLNMIEANNIYYIYSFQKGTYLKYNNEKTYLLDQTLEQLEQVVDPLKFFRINRKYLVALNAIKEVSIYSNSRLKLKVKGADEDDFLVAREKVKAFKLWLEGELESI